MIEFFAENKSVNRLFFFGFVVLLFLPKINIVAISTYEGAGIRLDDFILLFLGFFVLFFRLTHKKLSYVEAWFFIFVALGFCSFLLNVSYDRGSLFYVFRILEYWIFFYIGVSVKNFASLRRVLKPFIIINLLIICAQAAGIIGGFRDGVYLERARLPTGMTNGSYEVGFLLTLVAVPFFFSKDRFRAFFLIVLFICILLTQSRSAILLFVGLFVFSVSGRHLISLKTILSAVFGVAIASLIILSLDRFNNLSFKENFRAIEYIYITTPGEPKGVQGKDILVNQASYKTGQAAAPLLEAFGSNVDLSLLIRFQKWSWAFGTYFNQGGLSYLFGIGPGALGNALDGGLFRLLIENGMLGLLAYTLFLITCASRGGRYNVSLVSIFIFGNLFIDYYLSYKVASMFYLLIGVMFCSERLERMRLDA